MTCRELFRSALRMICEREEISDVSDYEDRAGYLIASFCNQFSTLDTLIKSMNGESGNTYTPSLCLTLDTSFPLADRFLTAATYDLSAMLVIDENEELSERFFALYSDAISSLQSTVICKKETISDNYKELI